MLNKTVLFLGDSITQGALAGKYENCYVEMFRKLTGANVVNYGLGGSRIARQEEIYLQSIFNYDFALRAVIMQSDADYVVVFGGVNDYLHGVAPLGKDDDKTPYTFYGALNNLYQKLIEKYQKEKIVVILPLNTSDCNVVKEKHGRKLVLSDYREAIRTVAKKYNLTILDITDIEELNPLIKESNKKYFDDGVHPNDLGHAILARKICDFFINTLNDN